MIFLISSCNMINGMLPPRLNLGWLMPSLSSASPLIPTVCKLGECLQPGLRHVNHFPGSWEDYRSECVQSRDQLGTWWMFHEYCFFYLEFLHAACPPPFLQGPYASGSVAILHIIIHKYFWCEGGGTAGEASEQHDFLPLEGQAHPAPQKRILTTVWKYIYRIRKNK